jgi:hypothetical protein
MVSIIIPSRTEKFLNNTIQSVLDNATGEIEVIPILDGYDEFPQKSEDLRVKYISLPNNGMMQKRQGVNAGVSIAKGEYIMCLDAHCMVGKGFDEILSKDCDDNLIVVPRRYKLDGFKWEVQNDQPPVDYEYWMWKYLIGGEGSHGFPELHDYRWDERQTERKDILIDDKLTMQASCWFMKKSYFQRMGFMKVNGYTGWGQEAEELCLSTWTTGGRVVVNKNTWYAHLYKGKAHGRMYFMSKNQRNESIHYSYNYWVKEHKNEFIKVIDKFMPIPNWPANWIDYI